MDTSLRFSSVFFVVVLTHSLTLSFSRFGGIIQVFFHSIRNCWNNSPQHREKQEPVKWPYNAYLQTKTNWEKGHIGYFYILHTHIHTNAFTAARKIDSRKYKQQETRRRMKKTCFLPYFINCNLTNGHQLGIIQFRCSDIWSELYYSRFSLFVFSPIRLLFDEKKVICAFDLSGKMLDDGNPVFR